LNKIQNIDYLGTSKIEVSPYVHKAIHIMCLRLLLPRWSVLRRDIWDIFPDFGKTFLNLGLLIIFFLTMIGYKISQDDP